MVSAILFPLFGAPASAQETDTAALETQIDAVYAKLLNNPESVDLNRQLVKLALQLKDYDAAIGAVERLLFYDPENPNLHIEVAGFYAQIESYAAATGYLNDALALPKVDAAQRKLIDHLLNEIEEATKPPSWSGMAQVGVRYQTNANIGPDFLGPDSAFNFPGPQEDWNAFGLGTLAYSNQVDEQHVLEGTLSGYYADQADIDRLDLGFVEWKGGVRFLTEDRSFKPYAILSGLLLGGDGYQFTFGGGVSARRSAGENGSLETIFEYEHQEFYDSDSYPSASNQSGNVFSAKLIRRGSIGDNTTVQASVGYERKDAVTDHHTYNQYVARVSATITFDVFNWENWKATPYASLFLTDFGGVAPPEVLASQTTVRQDFQWNVGIGVEIPVRERIAMALQLQYTRTHSTLDRHAYENIKATVGPVGRF